MRRVAHIMGMPVSIDIPAAEDDAPFDAAFRLLRAIDQRFSPYKSDSELRAFQAGRLTRHELSADMREVMAACAAYRRQTNGFFSAYFSGAFDPTGLVKGWAIARAGRELEQRGFGTYLINIAGDILARSNSGHVWRIALAHPQDARRTMGKVQAANIAVATSGASERGAHIIDPHSGEPAAGLLSATVVGRDIIAADVFATAAFAMGQAGQQFVAGLPGYEGLLVGSDLQAYATPGFSTQTVQ